MATATTAPPRPVTSSRSRHDGWVLALVCLAQFMVVLDVSIVNVALPSIRADLHFSATGLQWVVNAYTLSFAGFLLLGGRAADLFGRRRVFLIGLGMFTGASLIGGLAPNANVLLVARILQGLGGAVLSPATLTILTTTFRDGPGRARAMGAWSAVAGAGGAAGALLGGVLTDLLSWRWILFVNVPIGVFALLAARTILSESRDETAGGALDAVGALLVTGGLMALVYGIVNTSDHAWGSPSTLLTLGLAVVLLGAFLWHEGRRATAPLMPLRLFRSRSVSGANLVMFCVAAAIFATWYFQSLYLQQVLGYSPLLTGLAFLPQTLAIIVGAQVSSRLVMRFGPRPLLLVGTLLSAAGLAWLGQLTTTSAYLTDILVPSVFVTLGVGLAFTPIAFTATAGVARQEAGLASGLVNTTRQVGGSIGLAVLATLATAHTRALLGPVAAARAFATIGRLPTALGAGLTAGYDRAFLIGAVIALAATASSRLLPAAPAAPPGDARVAVALD